MKIEQNHVILFIFAMLFLYLIFNTNKENFRTYGVGITAGGGSTKGKDCQNDSDCKSNKCYNDYIWSSKTCK